MKREGTDKELLLAMLADYEEMRDNAEEATNEAYEQLAQARKKLDKVDDEEYDKAYDEYETYEEAYMIAEAERQDYDNLTQALNDALELLEGIGE